MVGPDLVTPVDCTGGSLSGQIRTAPYPEGDLLGEFSFEWTDIDTGDFEAVVVKETSNGIADGLHFYDWLFIDSNGRTGKIRSGRATKQGTYTEIS